MNRIIVFTLNVLSLVLCIGCTSISFRSHVCEQYEGIHGNYLAARTDMCIEIEPSLEKDFRTYEEVLNQLTASQSADLFFLLGKDAERIDLGPQDTPWIMCGLSKEECELVASGEWNTHALVIHKEMLAELEAKPKILAELRKVVRQVVRSDRGKKIRKRKDIELWGLTLQIKKRQLEVATQLPNPE